jgi:hypothetical protein
MSRLLAFGCSNTYGQGLRDCHLSTGEMPGVHSSFAWPSIVAKKLNLNLSNQSHPGASNKEIWNQILTNKFEETDTVVILWTHWDRWCIFHQDKALTKIGPWLTHKLAKLYYKSFHDDFDNGLDFWLRVNHIYTMLEQQGVRQYHLTCDNIERKGPDAPRWNRVKFTPVYFFDIRGKYPPALDGQHANEDAHRDFGMQLADHIKKYKY